METQKKSRCEFFIRCWRFVNRKVITISIATFILVLLQFLQQEPVIKSKINQSSKMLSIQNESLIPIKLTITSMAFDLNPDDLTTIEKYYFSKSHIFPEDILMLPGSEKNIDLKKYLDFSLDGSSGREMEAHPYCIVIDNVNYFFNNKSQVSVILTGRNSISSLYGSFNKDGSTGIGGDYAGFKKFSNTEDEIVNFCMSMYFKKIKEIQKTQ